MDKKHVILLFINLGLIIGFGLLFLARHNYEFITYIGAISVYLVLIGISLRKIDYTLATLVGLTVWAALHMAGGGVIIGEDRLYDVMLIPLSSTYPIFRYDQLVHIWGFGAATLLAYSLLAAPLKDPREHPIAVGFVLVMAGLGVGALNEILEFIVTIFVPNSGVGGYLNTSLDLCSDLIGAILALVYIHARYIGKEKVS